MRKRIGTSQHLCTVEVDGETQDELRDERKEGGSSTEGEES